MKKKGKGEIFSNANTKIPHIPKFPTEDLPNLSRGGVNECVFMGVVLGL